jgi:DNA-binding FadR family transcriptional regulator
MIGSTRHGHGRRRAGQSAADEIVLEIEARIRQERLPAGYRIGTKQELCEEFGVAPATLSEALRVLRARGVIDVRPGPGGGTFVANASPLIRLAQTVLALRDDGATVNDVVGVLDALDEAVIRDAALHRTARDLKDLDALMAKLAAAWHDPAEGSYCNWQLHRRIAEITPNAVLRAFYQNMVDYIEGEEVQAPLSLPGFRFDSEERLRVHYDILAVIRSRDAEAAREAAIRHRTQLTGHLKVRDVDFALGKLAKRLSTGSVRLARMILIQALAVLHAAKEERLWPCVAVSCSRAEERQTEAKPDPLGSQLGYRDLDRSND